MAIWFSTISTLASRRGRVRQYKWVRVQSPSDPNIWSTVARFSAPDKHVPNLADSISLLNSAAATLGKS